ncbi:MULTISPECIES: hypothetical protein [unclassified Endozoicomonas]|uniref:hypothetical protein n=2 Tax=unclassified Endozoicomonas TaxID=2644528 RepID=UPI003BB59462
MMKKSLCVAQLLLIASLSAICQGGTLKRRFVVDFQKDNADSSVQNISIKNGSYTLSCNQSDIANNSGRAESSALPDDKQRGLGGYGLMTFIESVSWQWIYISNLLVLYELVVINNAAFSHRYKLLLTWEAFMAVSWFAKNYRNPDSPQMGQPEAGQDEPFANTSMMLRRNGQQQGQQQSDQ